MSTTDEPRVPRKGGHQQIRALGIWGNDFVSLFNSISSSDQGLAAVEACPFTISAARNRTVHCKRKTLKECNLHDVSPVLT